MIVAAISQGVDIGHFAGGVGHVAPGVVFIRRDAGGGEGFGRGVVGDLVQAGDVALLVGFVVVGVAGVFVGVGELDAVIEGQRSAGGVVDEVHLGAAPLLADDLAVLRCIIMHDRRIIAVHESLAGADAVGAVAVPGAAACPGQARQLAAVFPGELVVVAVKVMRRVADRAAAVAFVGKLARLAVDRDAGEQVFPVAGVVVGERFRHTGTGDGADVACGIVGVRRGVAVDRLAQQLVLGVIGIRALDIVRRLIAPGDAGDIPHRVVCVACSAIRPAGAEAGVGLAGDLRRRAGGGDVAIGIALGVEPRHGFAGQALQVIVGERCGSTRAEVGGGHGAVAGVVGVAPGVGFGGRFAIFRLEQGPALLFDAVGIVVEGLRPLLS